MINIQGAPDIIPLLPFVGIFAALTLVHAIDQGASLLSRGRRAAGRRALEACGFLLIFGLIVLISVADAFAFTPGFPTLPDQEAQVAEITACLRPGDKIFVHGRTEILVLAGLTNASRYFFLNNQKDRHLDGVEPGGFDGWLKRLKRDRPRVVALDRLGDMARRDDLLRWVAGDYEMRKGRLFTYYVRKDTHQ